MMNKKMVILTIVQVLCSVGWSYTVSGTVIDRDTLSPLGGMRVSCWNQDLEEYTEDWTLADGSYALTVNAGRCSLRALPESVYARMGCEVEITGDLSGQDFALGPEAILSGRLVDSDTAEPLTYQQIWYWNDMSTVWQEDYTDADGFFELRALPPGIAEVEVKPDIALGYTGHLPWKTRMIDLAEGEIRDTILIFADKGALVTGQFVDINNDPISKVPVDITGDHGDAWVETNINGEFQMRLVPGRYTIKTDSDEGDDPVIAVPVIVEIDDLSPVSVPPITCYTETTGGQISGTIDLAPGAVNTGYLGIAVFEVGTVITPATFDTSDPVIFVPVDPDGPFAIPALPPGSYDLYLVQFYFEQTDDVGSYTILGRAMNIAVNTTSVVLSNTPGTITVTGTLQNPNGLPIFLAQVFLEHTSGPEPRLAGFADTDADGSFYFYNIEPGDYILSVLHPSYSLTPAPVMISGTGTMAIGTVTADFAGVKEGADLDGDGLVALGDIVVMAGQWLSSESSADLDESGKVDLSDLSRLADLWMWKALWLNH